MFLVPVEHPNFRWQQPIRAVEVPAPPWPVQHHCLALMHLLTYRDFETVEMNVAFSSWCSDQFMFGVDFILKFKSIIFCYKLIYFEKRLEVVFIIVDKSWNQ